MSNLREAMENVLSRFDDDLPPAKRAKFEENFAKFLQSEGFRPRNRMFDLNLWLWNYGFSQKCLHI